jgi:hypothetical protein
MHATSHSMACTPSPIVCRLYDTLRALTMYMSFIVPIIYYIVIFFAHCVPHFSHSAGLVCHPYLLPLHLTIFVLAVFR